MSGNVEVVRSYLDSLAAGPTGLAEARALLADELEYHDPLMTVGTADDLIGQLATLDTANADIEIQEMTEGPGVVAVLTSFGMPGGERLAFTQWFWVEDGRIVRSRVIYDPRPFLAAGQQ